ncbi:AraC family transcriptional regulator [Olivibacter sp. CPCC 100613]|uniref:helix-turn-helix domain-containing protein n=1 Tax=Olivibacter sp. CPCC 100613 TaxID=3079931 RepID=UPI002FFB8249
MELVHIFFAFTAGSLYLLSFLFLMNVPGVNEKANRWLGFFYCLLACTFTQLFIEAFGLGDRFPFVIHLLELPRWALLPCFYLAILYFVNPAKKSNVIFLHFLPVTLFFLFSITYIIPQHFNPTRTMPEFSTVIPLFIRHFFLFQFFLYWFLCFAQLHIHARNIRMISSSIEKIDLTWIKYVLFIVLFLQVIHLASGFEMFSTFFPVIYFVSVVFLSYFSLKQAVIYPVLPAQLPELEIVLGKKATYERLTPEQVDTLKTDVIRYIKTEKPYLEPGLTLPLLSEKIGISAHELSYVLNNGLSKNFYQFINEMRVEEVKHLLASGQAKHLDMFGVAAHAGFNSKTTFNTTFKKVTGQTPTEFVKSLNEPPS